MGVLDNVKDKASSAIEMSKLNSKIISEQNAINAVMKQIGEFYYNKYLEVKNADEGIKEFCAAIDGHNAAITEAKAEIKRIKNKTTAAPAAAGAAVCPACGKEVPSGMKFCGECGAKMPVPAPVPAAAGGTVCSTCSKENPSDAKFCTGCGGRLETGKRICACGAEVAPGMKFCSVCGAKFE